MHFPSYNYGYGSNGYNEYGGMIQDPERRAANQVAYQAALARRQAAALNRAQGGPGTSGNPLPMSQPHDWTNFDRMFPVKPGTNSAPVAGGAAAASATPAAAAATAATPAAPTPLGPLGSSANPIPLSPPHDWTYFSHMFPDGVHSSVPALPRPTNPAGAAIPGATAAPPTPAGTPLAAPAAPPMLFPQDKMADYHAKLYDDHRSVWDAGSPANLTFVNYAATNGLESAYRNADTILAPFRQQQPQVPGTMNSPRLFNTAAYLA